MLLFCEVLLSTCALPEEQWFYPQFNYFTFNRGQIDSDIYHINCGVIQGFPALRKGVTTQVKNIVFFSCVLI